MCSVGKQIANDQTCFHGHLRNNLIEKQSISIPPAKLINQPLLRNILVCSLRQGLSPHRPGCPGTHNGHQANPALTEILLHLPSEGYS